MTIEHTTGILLRRLRDGDDAALDQLGERYLGPLRVWAAGRLPRGARDIMDTEDIVQETFYRAIPHLQKLEEEGEGAVLAYMRQAVLNQVRNEIKKAGRRPTKVEPDDTLRHAGRSPLDDLLGRESAERYERALSHLSPMEREAVTMRLEFGYRYQEIAVALGKPSANAARMAVSRALLRLAQHMAEEDGTIAMPPGPSSD
jgi:RNA polymerase sigma-70 factor (ECF subfamily)